MARTSRTRTIPCGGCPGIGLGERWAVVLRLDGEPGRAGSLPGDADLGNLGLQDAAVATTRRDAPPLARSLVVWHEGCGPVRQLSVTSSYRV